MERIDRAAEVSGRSASQIKLVLVTKTQPVEVARAAILAGANILGENYPEEALPKIRALKEFPEVEWHLIGHVQSRKAKFVVEDFALIHSIDSFRLAKKINDILYMRNRILPILLEINMSGEKSKYGWLADQESQWNRVLPEIEQVFSLSNLRILGLMTMPPLSDNAEMSRPFFDKLRKFRDFIAQSSHKSSLPELSMGTSMDFEVAIQEGATMVRIGQAILGERPIKKKDQF